MGHITQLRGMASTLRMRTATSPEQWQPWKAVSALKKICGLIDKKIEFKITLDVRPPPPPPHTHTHTHTDGHLLVLSALGSGIRNYWPGDSTAL